MSSITSKMSHTSIIHTCGNVECCSHMLECGGKYCSHCGSLMVDLPNDRGSYFNIHFNIHRHCGKYIGKNNSTYKRIDGEAREKKMYLKLHAKYGKEFGHK